MGQQLLGRSESNTAHPPGASLSRLSWAQPSKWAKRTWLGVRSGIGLGLGLGLGKGWDWG